MRCRIEAVERRCEHEESAGETVVTTEFLESGEETVVRLTDSGSGTEEEEEEAGHAQGRAATSE